MARQANVLIEASGDERHLTNSNSSTHSLTFPTLQVNASLADLASQTKNMPSLSNEPASSLDDSTYDLLGDSAVLTSDDEDARTESLASTTDDGDAYSIAETEESDDVRVEPVERSVERLKDRDEQAHQAQSNEPLNQTLNEVLESSSGVDSGLTLRPEYQALAAPISFHPVRMEATATESIGAHHVGNYGLTDMPESLRIYKEENIRLSLQMSMSTQYLSLKKPFKVLYVGEAPEWVRDEISNKIATALAATVNEQYQSSQGPTRHTVIPISSFGSQRSPEVQLIRSSGIELDIDEVEEATFRVPYSWWASSVVLTLSNGTELFVKDGKAWTSKRDKYPLHDIAVFLHPHAEPEEPEEAWKSRRDFFAAARSAMISCHVPMLDISQTRLFGNCPPMFKSTAKELCLQVSTYDEGASKLQSLETLPVDLPTFLDIDALQLNKHLASVVRDTPAEKTDAMASTSKDKKALRQRYPLLQSTYGDFKGLYDQARTRGPVRTRVIYSVLTLLFVLMAALSPTLSVPTQLRSSSVDILPAPFRSNYSTGMFATSSAVLMKPSSTAWKASTPSISSIAKPVTEKSLGQPLEKAPAFNESYDFKAHVIGDHHFVLTPPKQFLQLRKPPKVFVEVVRKSQQLNITISKLGEGAYAIGLEPEQAYGTLNVSVYTKGKPTLQQRITLNFGSPWLKLSTWTASAEKVANAARKDFTLVQQSMRDDVVRRVTGIQHVAKQITGTASTACRSVGSVTDVSIYRAFNLTARAERFTKDVVSTFAKQQERNVQKSLQRGSGVLRTIQGEARKTIDACTRNVERSVSTFIQSVRDLDAVSAVLQAPSTTIHRARRNAIGIMKSMEKERARLVKEAAKLRTEANVDAKRGKAEKTSMRAEARQAASEYRQSKKKAKKEAHKAGRLGKMF